MYFSLYACFGTNIKTFQKEIPFQTVKIKIYFRHHLGFLKFPHWQNHSFIEVPQMCTKGNTQLVSLLYDLILILYNST